MGEGEGGAGGQGVSSQFLIDVGSPLAALYDGDRACLEQHHAFRAFELLSRGAGGALLAPLRPGARPAARRAGPGVRLCVGGAGSRGSPPRARGTGTSGTPGLGPGPQGPTCACWRGGGFGRGGRLRAE